MEKIYLFYNKRKSLSIYITCWYYWAYRAYLFFWKEFVLPRIDVPYRPCLVFARFSAGHERCLTIACYDKSMPHKKGASLNKKLPSLKTRVGKYYMAVQEGKTKAQAQREAGYSIATANSSHIEKTKGYQLLETTFREELLKRISLGEISEALIDNIKQEGSTHIDRASRNKAIEMAKNDIEPNASMGDEGDKVLIILK